jgi:hypothetical protein
VCILVTSDKHQTDWAISVWPYGTPKSHADAYIWEAWY